MLLDVAAIADRDRLVVAAQHRAEPDADVLAQGYLADDVRIILDGVPGSLDDYADLLIPELQRRGMFRKAYPDGTLRNTLGLKRPLRSE